MHSSSGRLAVRLRQKTLWVGALVCLFGGTVFGHEVQTSWTVVRFGPDVCELRVKMHGETVRALIQDEAPEATLEPENIDNVRPLLAAFANDLYEVSAGGRRLAASRTDVTLTDDNLEFHLVYTRPADGPLRLKALYLSRVGPDFIANVSVEGAAGGPPVNKVLNARAPSVEIEPPSGAAGAGAAPDSAFLFFLKLGVEHILTGYDHLLFLLGLLLACRRFKTMALVVTCFTLAHSVTLALSALDLVSLPPRVVEPLIAASIVFVGVENLLRRDEPRWRWVLTFGFGLIHGFGFAGVLREVGLGSSGSTLVAPLFSFNLGVELGQLAVTAIFLPVLWRLRERPAFARYGLPALSAVVALAGAYWLISRLFF